MDNLFWAVAIISVSFFAGFQARGMIAQRRRRRQRGFWAVPLLFFAMPLADAATLSPEMPHFQFEQEAQQHCPADTIVWVVVSRGFYNSSSERWYGRTSNGTYACLGDAAHAGYRPTSVASAAQ
jgi:peptidoglycan/LPS O-acetylase OafA/YrhL